MTKNLTAQQEEFAVLYVELGNASKAYERAYDAMMMTEGSIYVEASRLLNHPKVSLRISELRNQIAERNLSSIDDLLIEIEQARQLAFRTHNSSAMTAATMAKARLLGMLKDNKNRADNSGREE
ncbi:Terminase small subunit [Pasteurella testudinis DSM 23072]|uniref:Terminase small subunit n=1 Tax=Pasteurella testudinis DSM 23072 TaxID=1122938 RepID=A0A1W1V279_9PAST|nr:terminase small subunit [Pasteurella testudinis]SMB87487.1 Terminase small subunit [Pasteurella testudinis DSM 23072]SUB50534.1 Terminase small subunit [Pasteurella testudinis]